MLALVVAAGSSVLGAVWSLAQLRRVVQAGTYQWERLLRLSVHGKAERVALVLRGHGTGWEAELAAAMAEPEAAGRNRVVNLALHEAEGAWVGVREGLRGSVRMVTYGGLLAVALVVLAGPGGALRSLVGVLAVAAAGLWIVKGAERMALRMEREGREQIDRWVSTLLAMGQGSGALMQDEKKDPRGKGDGGSYVTDGSGKSRLGASPILENPDAACEARGKYVEETT